MTRRVTGRTFYVAVLSQQGRDAVAAVSWRLGVFHAVRQARTAHFDHLRWRYGDRLGLRLAPTPLLAVTVLHLDFILFHFTEKAFSRGYDSFRARRGATKNKIRLKSVSK